MANQPEPSLTRIALFGLVGNLLEWYDFAVYGFFAQTIGKQFFPSEDPAVSLIASFGAFAAGFLARPLGGLILGRIGDRISRERALFYSIAGMAIPTVGMAFLPTYAIVGIWAPVAMILLRMIQGLSLGGEFTSSLVFLVEHAPPHRRGFMAIWGSWGASAGTLLGSLMALVMAKYLSPEDLESWGWRLAFLLGGLVAVVGLWVRALVRHHLPHSSVESPVKEVFRSYKRPMLKIALLNVGNGVAYYTAFIYAANWHRTAHRLSDTDAFLVNTLSMLVLLAVMPLGAWLSDRIGRRPVLLGSLGLLVILALPLFGRLLSSDFWDLLWGEMGFAVLLGFSTGAVAAANVELMPFAVRCTGLAFAYNAAIGLLGGTTPMINALLVQVTAWPLAPALWVMVVALVSFSILLFWIREPSQYFCSEKTT